VAVVVTKLTGALLFILLLTMVIVVLIPRGSDGPPPSGPEVAPLKITLASDLPDAIAGRSYNVALAASGGLGRYEWSIEGVLPEGLALNDESGQISGVPRVTAPAQFTIAVEDGLSRVRQAVRLQVLDRAGQPAAATTRAQTVPALRDWLAAGFGYLVLVSVWLSGIALIGALERWSTRGGQTSGGLLRFQVYRGILSITAVALVAALGVWLRS
jgi:hypothetical protein